MDIYRKKFESVSPGWPNVNGDAAGGWCVWGSTGCATRTMSMEADEARCGSERIADIRGHGRLLFW
jgi:hypothetical protein